MTKREFSPGTFDPYNVDGGEVLPGERYGYKVIALIGHGGKDWAAYRGPTNLTDQEIADSGDKISKTAAEALFPTFRNMGLRYRE
jgi:hypothetical protein